MKTALPTHLQLNGQHYSFVHCPDQHTYKFTPSNTARITNIQAINDIAALIKEGAVFA